VAARHFLQDIGSGGRIRGWPATAPARRSAVRAVLVYNCGSINAGDGAGNPMTHTPIVAALLVPPGRLLHNVRERLAALPEKRTGAKH
jgi:hypothetical protein